LTPPLDQRTIDPDHLSVAPEVIKLVTYCPRLSRAFF